MPNATFDSPDLTTFARLASLSGQVPLVGIVAGRCFAGNAALLGVCDLIVAVEGASIGLGGPAMIEGGGLGRVEADAVGPVDVQSANGVDGSATLASLGGGFTAFSLFMGSPDTYNYVTINWAGGAAESARGLLADPHPCKKAHSRSLVARRACRRPLNDSPRTLAHKYQFFKCASGPAGAPPPWSRRGRLR